MLFVGKQITKPEFS